MGKKHYLGGGTLIGTGPVSKAKGRSGGIDTTAAAVRQKQRDADKERRRKLDANIAKNQKAMRELGKGWAAEKGKRQYEELYRERRAKASPLAAALNSALKSKDKP